MSHCRFRQLACSCYASPRLLHKASVVQSQSSLLSTGCSVTCQNMQVCYSHFKMASITHCRCSCYATPGLLHKASVVQSESGLLSTGRNGLCQTWQVWLLQVQTAPLQLLCKTQIAAQSISGSAGQAVTNAIPSSFGPSPCKLFEGERLLLMCAVE